MIIIYMKHTLNFIHSRGIDLEVKQGVDVRQEDKYIVIEELNLKKENQ